MPWVALNFVSFASRINVGVVLILFTAWPLIVGIYTKQIYFQDSIFFCHDKMVVLTGCTPLRSPWTAGSNQTHQREAYGDHVRWLTIHEIHGNVLIYMHGCGQQHLHIQKVLYASYTRYRSFCVMPILKKENWCKSGKQIGPFLDYFFFQGKLRVLLEPKRHRNYKGRKNSKTYDIQ